MGTINEIVKLMKEHPDLKFSVEGHTDSDGEESFNQKLSEERATAVKTALIENGIDQTRLETKGWGETNLLTPIQHLKKKLITDVSSLLRFKFLLRVT